MAIALQFVGIRQADAELIPFTIDGTGTAAITEGKFRGTLTDNGTGDYTITLTRPAQRQLQLAGYGAETANLQAQIVSRSTSTMRVKFTNNSGTATDTIFDITLVAYYNATQR